MQQSIAAILFVDDDVDILKALKRALRGEPFQCLFAGSGSEALGLMEKHEVSVLVSDLHMPGMDGFELLERATEKWPDILRLVLSGRFDGDAVIDAVNKGNIYRYIMKPWDVDELRVTLRNALEVVDLQKEKKELLAALEMHNRQLEQKVEQRTQQLLKMRSQAEIGKYAAQIVHNLRSPLHALGGVLDLVHLIVHESMEGKIAELENVLKIGRKSLTDLRDIVSGILDHARAEGKFFLEKIDVNNVIRQELDFFNLDPLFKRNIKKQIQLGEKVPTISGSAIQIKQVLDNLIRNAIDAMASSEARRLTITTQCDEKAVYIEVGDTGEGISEENLPHIFSGEFTTKSRENGTGIGLSSVKRIVAAYGGDIQVRSQKGIGSTFRVALPIEPHTELVQSLSQVSI